MMTESDQRPGSLAERGHGAAGGSTELDGVDRSEVWSAAKPSLVHCFEERARELGSRVALRYRVQGAWHDLSWRDWQLRARAFAASLHALGIEPGDRVAIMSSTRVEWAIADLGSWMVGAVPTPIYPSSTRGQIDFIMRDSGAKLVVCEEPQQLDKLQPALEHLSAPIRAICLDGEASRGASGPGSRVMLWADALAHGQQHSARLALELDARVAALEPGSLATLVYTSGTNGRPKGVRLTHGNLMYGSEISLARLGIGGSDTQLLFLPMAHIMGRALLICAYHVGCVVALEAAPKNLLQSCDELGATFFCAVPRVLEKLHAALSPLPPERVREAFGERMRFILSGGAPLTRAALDFFRGAGVPVYEGYGLTESSGTLSVNLPSHRRDGSVGPAARGTRLRIAEDGEILASGPGIMQGYHGLPQEDRETLRVVEGGRWLCTGDVGRIDEAGFLWITDRKKDVFKLSTGKSVAPALIETLVKSRSELISQVVIFGEHRPYVTALFTLNPAVLSALGVPTASDDPSHHPEVKRRVEQAFASANEQLAAFEQIRRFVSVQPEFSLERDELTATLKVRRQTIIARHQQLLDSLYADDARLGNE